MELLRLCRPRHTARIDVARRLRAALLRLVGVLLVLAACGHGAAAGESSAEWLRQLQVGDVESRRTALQRLAEQGEFDAVPAVAGALRDQDGVSRKLAEIALWAIWSRSGDVEIDALLRAGSSLLAQGEAGQSLPVFTRIVERAPSFAEGWNKRATAYYHVGEYEKSLRDIDETLKRNPYHFGALSGAGLCLIELERFDQALGYFNRALRINPNMEGIVELKKAVEKRQRKPLV